MGWGVLPCTHEETEARLGEVFGQDSPAHLRAVGGVTTQPRPVSGTEPDPSTTPRALGRPSLDPGSPGAAAVAEHVR